jgi:hypothetical protein
VRAVSQKKERVRAATQICLLLLILSNPHLQFSLVVETQYKHMLDQKSLILPCPIKCQIIARINISHSVITDQKMSYQVKEREKKKKALDLTAAQLIPTHLPINDFKN